MIIAPSIETQREIDSIYTRAIARLERDLGWEAQQAHNAVAQIAQAYGVFLDDVAQAILGARSIKRGLAPVVQAVELRRRR